LTIKRSVRVFNVWLHFIEASVISTCQTYNVIHLFRAVVVTDSNVSHVFVIALPDNAVAFVMTSLAMAAIVMVAMGMVVKEFSNIKVPAMCIISIHFIILVFEYTPFSTQLRSK